MKQDKKEGVWEKSPKNWESATVGRKAGTYGGQRSGGRLTLVP